VCDAPWGVSFPNGSPAWSLHYEANWVGGGGDSLPVHPTQLYSVFFNWGIAGLMYWWYRNKKAFDGETFWLSAMLYAVARFLVELFRADERGEFLGLSTSQLIGILLVVLSIYMLSKLYRRSLAQKPAAG
jgi:phosphatidylglycerol:prolipoprotein diacylglycerol transferase